MSIDLGYIANALAYMLVLYRTRRASADAKVLLGRLLEMLGRPDIATSLYKVWKRAAAALLPSADVLSVCLPIEVRGGRGGR